jgi:hypothetical protein
MLTDAYIRVVCDKCQKSEEEIELTATARGYDTRAVDAEIESLGWEIIDENTHHCPDCIEEEER